VRIAFFGTPQVAVPYLDALLASRHEVCAVVTQPDRPAGRGQEVRTSPVKARALAAAACLLQPETCRDVAASDGLRACSPELGVVVAYGQILPPAVLGCPPRGCVNVHYSLLPALRGAAPVQHALLAGLSETGVTVQWMAEELDSGDVILQQRVAIAPEDDQAALLERLTGVGVPLLVHALDLIEAGSPPRVPQDHARATWAPELSAADCRVDWSAPAEQIRNQARACSPKPGAYTFRDGRRLKLLAVDVAGPTQGDCGGEPGSFGEPDACGCPVVQAGRGRVVLREVQPEGRRAMSGAEFARGARLGPRARLG
jgi:methionyl-tRNA formyltransferase